MKADGGNEASNSSTIKTLHVTVLQLEMKGEWRSFANRWTKMGKKMVKKLGVYCYFLYLRSRIK